jgi:S1-C subfamily serine protease
MNDSTGEPLSWNCPACNRRVPARFEDCRCGFRRQAAPPFVASPAETAETSRSGPSASLLLILGAAIGIGVAVFVVRSRSEQPVATTSAPVVITRTQTMQAKLDTASEPPPPDAPPASDPQQKSIEAIVSESLPAVASIDTGTARGSGFFVKPDLVVTNNHVVEGQNSVQLQAGSAKYTARVMTTSPGVDLALLQVYGANPNQATLKLGSTSDARAGEEVIAIGYALGTLSNTVTRGIVSAVRQSGTVTLIQTDAAINPGNSGGPLLNRNGDVIGINSMGMSKQVSEGLGFAISVDHVRDLLAGHTTASTATTPLAQLTQSMTGASDADQQRAGAQARLEQTFAAAAQYAAQLDGDWDRGARTCVSGVPGVGDRPWFAAWEPGAVRLAVNNGYDCNGWLGSFTNSANQFRAALMKATDGARSAGVYPGVIRDLRHKYRLDWRGWDQ